MMILSFYTVTLFASWYILLHEYNLLVFFLKYLLYCIDSTLRK